MLKAPLDISFVRVPPTGLASCNASVHTGVYGLGFDSSGGDSLPAQQVRVLRGCPMADSGCTSSRTDLTGRWLVDFSGWMFGSMIIDLVSDGPTLSGTFDFVSLDAGNVSGWLDGSSVRIEALGTDYPVLMTGTLPGGCLMCGRAECNGQTSD